MLPEKRNKELFQGCLKRRAFAEKSSQFPYRDAPAAGLRIFEALDARAITPSFLDRVAADPHHIGNFSGRIPTPVNGDGRQSGCHVGEFRLQLANTVM